jgi:hypothetical protein
VRALRIHMPPPAGSVDDVFAADAADWLTACDAGAPRTQIPHNVPIVVEFVGVREHPRPATTDSATVDVMQRRAGHRRPYTPF